MSHFPNFSFASPPTFFSLWMISTHKKIWKNFPQRTAHAISDERVRRRFWHRRTWCSSGLARAPGACANIGALLRCARRLLNSIPSCNPRCACALSTNLRAHAHLYVRSTSAHFRVYNRSPCLSVSRFFSLLVRSNTLPTNGLDSLGEERWCSARHKRALGR